MVSSTIRTRAAHVQLGSLRDRTKAENGIYFPTYACTHLHVLRLFPIMLNIQPSKDAVVDSNTSTESKSALYSSRDPKYAAPDYSSMLLNSVFPGGVDADEGESNLSN
jgi:hypothetical protein